MNEVSKAVQCYEKIKGISLDYNNNSCHFVECKLWAIYQCFIHFVSLIQTMTLRSKYYYYPQCSNGEPISVSLSYLPKDGSIVRSTTKVLNQVQTLQSQCTFNFITNRLILEKVLCLSGLVSSLVQLRRKGNCHDCLSHCR